MGSSVNDSPFFFVLTSKTEAVILPATHPSKLIAFSNLVMEYFKSLSVISATDSVLTTDLKVGINGKASETTSLLLNGLNKF